MPWNIEIETPRVSARKINEKYRRNMLLSIISKKGHSVGCEKNNMFYSLLDYNMEDNSINCRMINFKLPWLTRLTSDNNLKTLERIMGREDINPSLKRAILFFMGDLIVYYNRNSIKPSFFYNPSRHEFSKSVIMLGFGTKGENILIPEQGVLEEIVNHNLKKSFENYLRNNYSKSMKNIILSRDFSILTDDETYFNELVQICRGSEVSGVYLISGTSSEVRAGASVKEIKFL